MPGSRQAVELFSGLALVCAVTMGITGLLTAEIHLGGREDGWGLITQWVTTRVRRSRVRQGRRVRPSGPGRLVASAYDAARGLAAGDPAAFRRLAVVELLIMAATVGLAVALSRTP